MTNRNKFYLKKYQFLILPDTFVARSARALATSRIVFWWKSINAKQDNIYLFENFRISEALGASKRDVIVRCCGAFRCFEFDDSWNSGNVLDRFSKELAQIVRNFLKRNYLELRIFDWRLTFPGRRILTLLISPNLKKMFIKESIVARLEGILETRMERVSWKNF